MARMDKLSAYHTSFTSSGGHVVVTYRGTKIVERLPNGEIILNTGGWKSVTTKRKMNQAANQFGLDYQVFQVKGVWYVGHGEAGGLRDFVGDVIVLNGWGV